MSGQHFFSGVSSSPFARHVAEWKSDVESYFRNDWSKLRTLILQLENQSWSNQLNLSVDAFSECSDVVVSPATESQSSVLRDDSRVSSSPAEVDSTTDRLLQLSVQIEQQLSASARQQESP